MWKHKKCPFEPVDNLNMNFEGPFIIYIFFYHFHGLPRTMSHEKVKIKLNLREFFHCEFFSFHYSPIID